MPEPSAESFSEFVTVSEAARALGLSERQARRRAAVLEASGRTRTDGRTRLVTVADMMTARPDADKKTSSAPVMASDDASERTTGHDHMTDRTDIKNDRTDATDRPDGHDELVNQLRSENVYLREQAQKWEAQAEKALQLVDQAQQLQLVAERKVAELEGKLLPAVEQKETPGHSSASQTESSVLGGGITPPSTIERPWWAFWKRGS